MFSWLKNLETRLPWGVIGVIISIIFGIVGLYTYFHEKKPNVTYEIISRTNVLDVRQPVNNLVVVFQGQDIEKENLNLEIITIRIKNDGEIDILQNQYDQSTPFGLRIENGKIIEKRLINSSNSYLASNIGLQSLGENMVAFNKVIFEKEENFTIELLLLRKKDMKPEIIPFGKIAGISKINLVTENVDKKDSIISTIFSESMAVNLLRLVVNIFILLLLVISLIVPWGVYESYQMSRDSKIRRERIQKLIDSANIKVDNGTDILIDLYSTYGYSMLKDLKAELSKKYRLLDYHDRNPRFGLWLYIKKLTSFDLVKIDIKDETVYINDDFMRTLDYLLEELRSFGEHSFFKNVSNIVKIEGK